MTPLFSLTLFLSAALTFSLQPMVGKILLPIVGGTPAGWIVVMSFFQLALLLGYYIAHLLSRLSPYRHGMAFIGTLLLGALFLPVQIGGDDLTQTPGIFGTFALLAGALTVPAVALFMASSTLQRIFAGTGTPESKNPYFLYAASNLGSFAGLLLYPFAVEPYLSLSLQTKQWFWGYGALFLLAAACFYKYAGEQKETPRALEKSAIDVKQCLLWVALAFIPSSLMMGVTTYITTDIFSAPLLWVMPLGLYLLTFVAAFAQKQLVSFDWVVKAHPVAVMLAIMITFLLPGEYHSSFYTLGLHLVFFSIIALLCHMRLARSRPEKTEDLTLFYLMLALGGALGGIANSVIAPLAFRGPVEYPLVLLASCLLSPQFKLRKSDVAIFATLLVLFVASSYFRDKITLDVGGMLWIAAIGAILTFKPREIMTVGAVVFIIYYILFGQVNVTFMDRSFFGITRVYEQLKTINGQPAIFRYMSHGTTVHGMQARGIPGIEKEPTTYYARSGPLGGIFSLLNPRDTAAVGLGAGAISCYATTENKITFFEIDPLVAEVAQKHFTYLSDCGTSKPEIVLGDARLSLLQAQDKKYDLIILDAFSSDSIPTHLMTREAMQIYMDRLTPRGSILFHISNRFFDLAEPLAATGDSVGLSNRFTRYLPEPGLPLAAESIWLLMTKDQKTLNALAAPSWGILQRTKDQQAWTDNYANLLDALKWKNK